MHQMCTSLDVYAIFMLIIHTDSDFIVVMYSVNDDDSDLKI